MGEDRLSADAMADQARRECKLESGINQMRHAAANLHASTLSSEELERDVATSLSWMANVLEFGSPYANAAADALEDLVVKLREHGKR